MEHTSLQLIENSKYPLSTILIIVEFIGAWWVVAVV